MGKTILRAVLAPIMFTAIASVAFGQAGTYNENNPAGSGTLSCTVKVSDGDCYAGGSTYKPTIYTESYYSNFSYVVSGTSTPLSGVDESIWDKGSGGTCPASTWPSVALTGTDVQGTFTLSGTTGGTASFQQVMNGFINPKYVVVGVVYAPPGPSSMAAVGFSFLRRHKR